MQIDILLFLTHFVYGFHCSIFWHVTFHICIFSPQRKVLFFLFLFFNPWQSKQYCDTKKIFVRNFVYPVRNYSEKSEIVMSYSFWDVAFCFCFLYLEKEEVFLIFIIFAAFGQGIQTGKKMPVITYYLIMVPGICVW